MEKKMESIDIVRACEKDVAMLCSLGSETFSETFAGENSEEDMRKCNEKAKAFYAHHGFERFGEHVFVLGDDRQTDFLLRKFL